MADGKPLRVGVVIATKGRPDVAKALVAALAQQSMPPHAIMIAVSDPADATGIPALGSVKVVMSRPGSCAQRNAGLDALPGSTDVVVFFDDDFVPSRFWIENVGVLFARAPDIAVATGRVLIDGIKTAGLSWAEGARIVARADAAPQAQGETILENHSPYGCNMAFRRAAVGNLRFDERLVLYGWQEDTDFAARVTARGRMVWSDRLWGVHLGIKRGRSPGRQFGYSQMVNPRYLVAKGTMRAASALRLAGRNLAANAARALFPEPYIDRAGRLKGNLLGLWDIATGHWRPERAAEL
jgi:GT2 family glycosyltransferase